MFRLLFLFLWRTKIHFKTLKLVKLNYCFPANFIPKYFLMSFFPFTVEILGIPLILLSEFLGAE